MSELPCTGAPVDTEKVIGGRSAQPASGPPAVEQRSRQRHCCGTITFTRMSLAAAERTHFAWVHDISEDGIGLEVLGPLAAGVHLVFELKRGDDEKRIRLHARVVHATPAGAFYRLGCRFTRPLRPEVLAHILECIRSPQAAG